MDAVQEVALAPCAAESSAAPETRTTLTIFTPGEKARGRRRTSTWERFFAALASVKPTTRKEKLGLPGWCAATFKDDHRCLAAGESVHAVVLDFDNTWTPAGSKKSEPLPEARRVTPQTALDLWMDTLSFFYTSWSHTPVLPKFRLVVVLSRPVTFAEFPMLWAYVAGVHERAGHVVDPQCKDASHLWFFGARRDEQYATAIHHGQPLDVDMVLAAAEIESDVTPGDEPPVLANGGAPDVQERARRYVRRMPEAISGSGGHRAAIKAALAVVRGFGLAPDDAVDVLKREYNPRCQPPWTEKELQHKVESAAKFERAPVGYLLRPRSASAMLATILSESDATPSSDGSAPGDQPFTDDGNALRLVDAFGATIRYVVEWQSYIRWNGKVWDRDPEAHLVREDMRLLTRRWADAAMKIGDEEARKRATAWALKSQAAARLEAAVELAKGDARIRVHAREIDASPFLLNVQNGILDLREIDDAKNECKLLAHDPKHLLTRITKFGYVPGSVSPTWEAFCTFSANGDREVEAYRRRRRGSYLSGSPDKVFEIAFGKGDTGKTSYYQTITRTMGTYAQKVSRTIFEKQRGEQHPADLMELDGVRFVFGAEIEDQIDIKKVKDITGERVIKARGMRENWQSLERRYKVAIFANEQPKIARTVADPILEPHPRGQVGRRHHREAVRSRDRRDLRPRRGRHPRRPGAWVGRVPPERARAADGHHEHHEGVP